MDGDLGVRGETGQPVPGKGSGLGKTKQRAEPARRLSQREEARAQQEGSKPEMEWGRAWGWGGPRSR